MVNVAVLGSTGMLGSAIAKYFESKGISVYEFNRSGISVCLNNQSFKFDATDLDYSLRHMENLNLDYVVNCIGTIKHLINVDDMNSVKNAYTVNSDFLFELNQFAKSRNLPIIQIGTDCVFSGSAGGYSEVSPHDPVDIYGITKSKGELLSNASMILRCSIVGKELETSNSLLSWVLSHPINAEIMGFTDHYWNGVTTLHFAKIVYGIVKSDIYEIGKFHLIPSDSVSKYELISYISKAFGRSDLKINRFDTLAPVNRILQTLNPERNRTFWLAGGYNQIPTIEQMVSTYAAWSK